VPRDNQICTSVLSPSLLIVCYAICRLPRDFILIKRLPRTLARAFRAGFEIDFAFGASASTLARRSWIIRARSKSDRLPQSIRDPYSLCTVVYRAECLTQLSSIPRVPSLTTTIAATTRSRASTAWNTRIRFPVALFDHGNYEGRGALGSAAKGAKGKTREEWRGRVEVYTRCSDPFLSPSLSISLLYGISLPPQQETSERGEKSASYIVFSFVSTVGERPQSIKYRDGDRVNPSALVRAARAQSRRDDARASRACNPRGRRVQAGK